MRCIANSSSNSATRPPVARRAGDAPAGPLTDDIHTASDGSEFTTGGPVHRDMVTDRRIIVGTHADEPRVKVLSIVGEGRSGSTVLAAILGEVAGFFDA